MSLHKKQWYIVDKKGQENVILSAPLNHPWLTYKYVYNATNDNVLKKMYHAYD